VTLAPFDAKPINQLESNLAPNYTHAFQQISIMHSTFCVGRSCLSRVNNERAFIIHSQYYQCGFLLIEVASSIKTEILLLLSIKSLHTFHYQYDHKHWDKISITL